MPDPRLPMRPTSIDQSPRPTTPHARVAMGCQTAAPGTRLPEPAARWKPVPAAPIAAQIQHLRAEATEESARSHGHRRSRPESHPMVVQEPETVAHPPVAPRFPYRRAVPGWPGVPQRQWTRRWMRSQQGSAAAARQRGSRGHRALPGTHRSGPRAGPVWRPNSAPNPREPRRHAAAAQILRALTRSETPPVRVVVATQPRGAARPAAMPLGPALKEPVRPAGAVAADSAAQANLRAGPARRRRAAVPAAPGRRTSPE